MNHVFTIGDSYKIILLVLLETNDTGLFILVITLLDEIVFLLGEEVINEIRTHLFLFTFFHFDVANKDSYEYDDIDNHIHGFDFITISKLLLDNFQFYLHFLLTLNHKNCFPNTLFTIFTYIQIIPVKLLIYFQLSYLFFT